MDLETISGSAALLVRTLGGILISVCQLLAVLVIFIGIVRALVIYLKSPFVKAPLPQAFQKSRLMMGYSFSLGLSFLIGATILKTMVSSQWEDIARLAVIIAVRTILNHLLLQAINASNDVQAASSEMAQLDDSAQTALNGGLASNAEKVGAPT